MSEPHDPANENPEPGDADVTGGALDQSGRLTAGLAYVY